MQQEESNYIILYIWNLWFYVFIIKFIIIIILSGKEIITYWIDLMDVYNHLKQND